MTTTKVIQKITATFIPEAWISDYAVEIDGKKTWDATEDVLKLSAKEIKALEDNQYNTDDLVPDSVFGGHSGPFRVEIENAIRNFFKAHGYDEITDEAVAALRKLYRVRA